MPRAMRVPIKLQELDEPMEEDQASPSGMNIKTPPLETQGSVENDASTTGEVFQLLPLTLQSHTLSILWYKILSFAILHPAKGLSEGTETKKPSEPVMEAEKVAKQKVPSPQTSAPFLPPCIPGWGPSLVFLYPFTWIGWTSLRSFAFSYRKQTNATAEPRNNSSAASIPCVQPQISSVPQKHIQPQHLQQPTQQQLQSAPSALISSFLQVISCSSPLSHIILWLIHPLYCRRWTSSLWMRNSILVCEWLAVVDPVRYRSEDLW